MATQVQFRRGTTSDHTGFKGAVGEVTVDTTKQTVVIHDAVTTGGYPLLRQDGSNCLFSSGNVSQCAFKFSGDEDTGIIRPTNDNIALVTGGSTRLTIDGSGAATFTGNVTVNGTLTATRTSFSDQIALILALS